jgi:hypothetical protein
MEHIIDEIKQLDVEFIRVPNVQELFKSDKIYVIYFKFKDSIKKDFIIVKPGIEFKFNYTILHESETMHVEIYQTDEEHGIKNICNLFYNFCVNHLSNGYEITDNFNYVMFNILNYYFDKTEICNYHFRYYTLEDYNDYMFYFNESSHSNILTINNSDDLVKFYEIIDNAQTQDEIAIFIKLN